MESSTAPSSPGASDLPTTDTSFTLEGSRSGAGEKSKVTAPKKIIADLKGDIIFLVGPPSNATRIQVSSKALGLASPVFLAWFSPRFLEGTPTESGGPRTVPLPDDDPAAMTILCSILHFQCDQVYMPSFTVLESLAILVDKYDCSRALKPWTTSWIQRWPGSFEGEDTYFKLIHIAFAFDLPEVFHKAMLSVFREASTAEILDAAKIIHGSQMLPESLYRSIYQRQQNLLDFFHPGLISAIEPYLDIAATTNKPSSSDCSCDWAAKIGSYFISLSALALWPQSGKISTCCPGYLLNEVRRVTTPSDKSSMANHVKCDGRSCKMDFKNILGDFIQKSQKQITGLCLTCVKAGRVSPDDGNCQQEIHFDTQAA